MMTTVALRLRGAIMNFSLHSTVIFFYFLKKIGVKFLALVVVGWTGIERVRTGASLISTSSVT